MPTRVIVPWRPSPSREDAFTRLGAWYAAELPDFELITVDTDDGVFALSRCRNVGVGAVEDPDEVVVVNDADTLPEPAALRAAVAAAVHDGLVHLPYTAYHWLGAEGSRQFAAGVAPADCCFELVRGACSGVYVTTRRTWESHGGQDERFRGWGFEDAAWYRAHTTLLGAEPVRHDGRVFALHHAAETRAGEQYDANAALMARYSAAADDPGRMAALVAEGVSARA